MRRLGAAALVLSTACSYTYERPPTSVATRSCSSPRPAIDTAVGTTLAVPGVLFAYAGFDNYNSGGGGVALFGSALVVAGAVFYASAIHGLRDTSKCEREMIALREPPAEPLHLEAQAFGMTCEQRRLDMYSRAITGADQDQRVRLLTQLPSCTKRTERERAWALTRMAALDAGAGRCAEIDSIARQVYELDVALHDVVLMSDIEIKHCLQMREL